MTEKEQALAYLNRHRVLNISIIEPLRLERGQVLAAGPQGVAVQVEDVTMVAADSYAAAMALVPPDFHTLNVMGGRLAEQVQESLGLTCTCQCYQAAYLETERLPVAGDIRQLESCVHNLLLKAKLLGCTISVEMAQEILAQYSLDDPFVDVDSIIRKVCEGFGLSPEQLASRSRKQNLVVARNTIFYLARKHTELSLQDIGDKFSRRHSTVLKGIASVERELRRESPLGRQIAGTLALLERR